MQKKVALLGSTGSIGCNALKVVRHLGEGFKIATLAAAGSHLDLLEAQAREFHPELIAVYDEKKAGELRKRLPHMRIVAGMEGLKEAAQSDAVNFVISAMAGTIGIVPTVAAIEKGKTIALANKEVLVSAGEYVMGLAKQRGVEVIPIDSEHSALFQCLEGKGQEGIRRLILTASGGPFLHLSGDEMVQISVEQALSHPTWKMGPKITIDSSTLMNKGLEVIEAHWLFGIPLDQIEVVIHPQSVIHSMVEWIDGSMFAQMSEPSMIVPIQYALTYPLRKPGLLPPFDFTRFPKLEFLSPDHTRFPCLSLAFEAIRQGGTTPCYLNAANEVLVQRFVQKEIGWLQISQKLEKLLSSFQAEKEINLEKILETDTLARELAAIV